jgi:hypothetical protein
MYPITIGRTIAHFPDGISPKMQASVALENRPSEELGISVE